MKNALQVIVEERRQTGGFLDSDEVNEILDRIEAAVIADQVNISAALDRIEASLGISTLQGSPKPTPYS